MSALLAVMELVGWLVLVGLAFVGLASIGLAVLFVRDLRRLQRQKDEKERILAGWASVEDERWERAASRIIDRVIHDSQVPKDAA